MEINLKQTEVLQQDIKYRLFVNWLQNNGVNFENIQFPAAFGNDGVVGIHITGDIFPNQAIMAIPTKLVICPEQIESSDMKVLLEKEDLFFTGDGEDTDFNKLCIFLIYERAKGKRSFYHPWLSLTEHPCSVLRYTPAQLKFIGHQGIAKEAREMQTQFEKYWLQVQATFSHYSEYFPAGTLTYENCLWAYAYVMTRSFGWTLPGTFLVPLADFQNHFHYGTDHFLLNLDLELESDLVRFIKSDLGGKKETPYIKKHLRIDCSIVSEDLELAEQAKKALNNPSNPIKKYILNNQFLLQNQAETVKGLDKCRRSKLKQILSDINTKKLLKYSKTHLFDLDYFSSSDEEDNDSLISETDVESRAQECQLLKLKQQERDQVENPLYKIELERRLQQTKEELIDKVKENTSQSTPEPEQTTEILNPIALVNIPTVQDQNLNQMIQSVTGSIGVSQSGKNTNTLKQNEESSCTKTRLDETKNINDLQKQSQQNNRVPEQDKYNDKMCSIGSCTTNLEVSTVADEKLQREVALNLENQTKKQKNEEIQKEETIKDKSFDWFKCKEENNYFVVFSDSFEPKGDQLFTFYGKRTNRQLFLQYGFAYPNNKYDSFAFRIWSNTPFESVEKINFGEYLFIDYIEAHEWEEGILRNGKIIPVSELSREFRLKRSRVCEDLIEFCRIMVVKQAQGYYERTTNVKYSYPSSYDLELRAVEFCILIVDYLVKMFQKLQENKPWEQPIQILNTGSLQILKSQLTGFQVLRGVLILLMKKNDFKTSYIKLFEKLETEDSFGGNRQKIRHYLRKLFLSTLQTQELNMNNIC